MSIFLLLGFSITLHAKSASWWFEGRLGAQYVSQAVDLINTHRDLTTGVYVFIPGTVCDQAGTFTPPTPDQVNSIIVPLAQTGVDVGVSMNIDEAAMESGNCVHAAPAIAEWMKTIPSSRFMFDYEPANYATANPNNYATFLQQMVAVAHLAGKQVDMCIGGQDYFASHYNLWSNTGVDRIQSMGITYRDRKGTEQTEVTKMLNHFQKSQVTVGIGSMVSPPSAQRWTYNWNKADLQKFVQFLHSKGVQHIAIFRADITTLDGTTESWFYGAIRTYLTGGATNLTRTDNLTRINSSIIGNQYH